MLINAYDEKKSNEWYGCISDGICRDHKLTDDDDDDENKKKYFFLYKKNFNDCFQVSVKLNTQ